MFLNDWEDSKLDGLLADFNIKNIDGCEILLASYGEEYGYDGGAFVLFKKNERLYEVNGSHCSCYGLEGQWEPEKTTKEALLYRIKEGELGNKGEHCFQEKLLEILNSI